MYFCVQSYFRFLFNRLVQTVIKALWFFLFFAVCPSMEGLLLPPLVSGSVTSPGMKAAAAFCSSVYGSTLSGIHLINASLNLTLFNSPTEEYDFNFTIVFVTEFYYCCHFHGDERLSCLSTSYLEIESTPSLNFLFWKYCESWIEDRRTKATETSQIG